MKTTKSAGWAKASVATALLVLAAHASAQQQAPSRAQQRCNDTVDAANRGANRDITRVENEIERATGRAVDSANSCLARVGDVLVRSIPGRPSFSTISASQVVEMLADRACSVVQSRASDAAGRITRPIQSVNQSINQGIGEASAGAGLPNLGRVEIPQGQMSTPAPRPSDANPQVTPTSGAGGTSIWDRMTNVLRR